MKNSSFISKEMERTKEAAGKAIGKISHITDDTKSDMNFTSEGRLLKADKKLPSYYLVYILFVELLGFKVYWRRLEKVAWSILIDYQGVAFCIEFAKFGLELFALDSKVQKKQLEEIVRLICKGVKTAKPFFEWRAKMALETSELNVVNHSSELFERYEYFLEAYEKELQEYKYKNSGKRKEWPEIIVSRKRARWLAQATIEAFFSWTEHVFIHIAILQGSCVNGNDVASMAQADWAEKFKKALDINDKITKLHFDTLVLIRRQIRNFTAHGSFGKQSEAFAFHSTTGAIPISLSIQREESIISIIKE